MCIVISLLLITPSCPLRSLQLRFLRLFSTSDWMGPILPIGKGDVELSYTTGSSNDALFHILHPLGIKLRVSKKMIEMLLLK